MDIKIRYTWRRKSDGQIWQHVHDISEIEAAMHFASLLSQNDLAARDLWLGKVDINGKEVFDNDIVSGSAYNSWQGEWEDWSGTTGFMIFPFDRPDDFRDIELATQ